MDDDRPPSLQCDIELAFVGPNWPTINKWAADALRQLAGRIEKGEFECEYHDVPDRVGKRIGKIYLDRSEEL